MFLEIGLCKCIYLQEGYKINCKKNSAIEITHIANYYLHIYIHSQLAIVCLYDYTESIYIVYIAIQIAGYSQLHFIECSYYEPYRLAFPLLNRLYFFLGSGSEAGEAISCNENFTVVAADEIREFLRDDSREVSRSLLHFLPEHPLFVSNVCDSR